MDGHAAMAGRASRLFFFGFYFIVCLVVVTVVTAEAIISTFAALLATPAPACSVLLLTLFPARMVVTL